MRTAPCAICRNTIRDIDGETLSSESLDRLRAIDPTTLPLVEEGVRLGVPVGRVGNLRLHRPEYTDHAEERTPIPSQPIALFNKHTGALSTNDDVILPPGSVKLDWEVELAFVIGRTAWHVDEAEPSPTWRASPSSTIFRSASINSNGGSVVEGQELSDLRPLRSLAGDGRRTG